MEPPANATSMPEPPRHKLRLHLDLRLVALFLIIVIGAMLFLWKPWQQQSTTNSRTIEVTGSATVKSEPDEFIFSPDYEFSNPVKEEALKQVTAKSQQVVADLKKLGVKDSQIKTNASDYGGGFLPVFEGGVTTYTLSLTITADNKELAQKIQDYLVTTSPSGQITPETNFSDAKQKQLEAEARTAAEKDAGSKAETSAKNIGFKLGAVKTISEGNGFNVGRCSKICPLEDINNANGASSVKNLSIQPGENDLTYSIQVTYFIK